MSATIKVIAPIEPSGEFPVAAASDIGLDLENPNAGSVADAIEELRDVVGLSAGTPSDSSIMGEFATIKTNLGKAASGTEENPIPASGLYLELSNLADTIDTLLANVGQKSASKSGLYSELSELASKVSDLLTKVEVVQGYLNNDDVENKGVRQQLSEFNLNLIDLNDALGSVSGNSGLLSQLNTIIGGLNTAISNLDQFLDNQAADYEDFLDTICTYLGVDATNATNSVGSQITAAKEAIRDKLGRSDTTIDTWLTNINSKADTAEIALTVLKENTSVRDQTDYTTIGSGVNRIYEKIKAIQVALGDYDGTNTLKTAIDAIKSDTGNIGTISTSLASALGTFRTTSSKVESIKDTVEKTSKALGTYTEAAPLSTAIANLQTTVNDNYTDLDTAISDYAETTSQAIDDLQEKVNANHAALGYMSGSETVKSILADLRGHINTMLPPTLGTTRTGDKVYNITAKPKLTITVSVNRPLEAPLKIQTDGTDVLTPNQQNTRSATVEWEPTWQSANGLPSSAYKVIQLVNASDSSIVYATKTESCTFAENVYYGASDSATCTDPSGLVDHTGKAVTGLLSAGHPTSISFKNPPSAPADGCYYYYMYPTSYGEPIITSGGLDAGFIDLHTTWTNSNDISYNIYRSENKLRGTTVSIK